MTLPQSFIDEMTRTLGPDEAQRLFDSLSTAQPTSVRRNPRKMNADAEQALQAMLEGSTEVEWCREGRRLCQRPSFTMDPLFHAGAYYVQEASSMYVAHLINTYVRERDVTALDLCAAPGGKSTVLLSRLSEGSQLIANEVMPKRAQVLRENLSKWGARNVWVTNNRVSDFSRMREVFDLIVCDVPCSGEGMFRKDETAVSEWSTDNVEMCVERQRDIVETIWPCLKPGGLMIYSTCTFNSHEDEENVEWIERTLGAQALPCPAEPDWGIVGNLLPGGTAPCAHFFPHHVVGEGFFCALLRKEGEDETPRVPLTDRMLRPLHILPLERFDEGSVATVDVDRPTALQFLHGEALRLPADTPRGIVTITYCHLPLGQAKNIGNRANNLYPKEWRIRKQVN